MSDARLIPFSEAERKVWGHPDKGYILDWFYARNEKVSVNIFQLPAGGHGGHAPGEPAKFGADMVFVVLEGEVMVVDPEKGDNVLVREGETVFIPKDTWNNAFVVGDGVATCLEWFHPSPDLGTGGAYAKQFPDLEQEKWARDDYIGRWPELRDEDAANARIRVIRSEDYLWRMEAQNTYHVGLMVSNEHATLGKLFVRSGVRTSESVRSGDTGIYVAEGHLIVEIVETSTFFDLGPKDGCYIPAGAAHRFYNPTGSRVSAFFAVAPTYL